jgi:hypothetical protein
LVTSYEAGDVVLHNPFAVSHTDLLWCDGIVSDRP